MMKLKNFSCLTSKFDIYLYFLKSSNRKAPLVNKEKQKGQGTSIMWSELMCKKSVPKRLLLPTCLWDTQQLYITLHGTAKSMHLFNLRHSLSIYFQQSVSSSWCSLSQKYHFNSSYLSPPGSSFMTHFV